MDVVVSVGLDVIDVAEVSDSLGRFGRRYLTRVYSTDELARWEASDESLPFLAQLFSAKEATIKALRVEAQQPDWRSMEALPDRAGGAGRMRLSGFAGRLASSVGIDDLALRCTSDGRVATAVVVATRGTGQGRTE